MCSWAFISNRSALTSRLLAVLACLAAAIPAQNQSTPSDEVLYFVSATSTPKWNFSFPSLLLRWDAPNRSLRTVRQITSSVDYVREHGDERLLVIAEQGGLSAKVIRMDDPSSEVLISLQKGDVEVRRYFLALPERGSFFSVMLSRGGKTHFIGFPLIPASSSETPLATGDFNHLRVYGDGGGPGDDSDGLAIPLDEERRLWKPFLPYSNDEPVKRVMLTIPTPPDPVWLLFPDNMPSLWVAASTNRFRVLLRSGNADVIRSPGLGSVRVWIHDLVANKWHSWTFPGNTPNVRAFGDWLAAREAVHSSDLESPGAASWRRDENPSKPNVVMMYREKRLFQTGVLWLHHMGNGKSHRIETGQGDSEVLLVDSKAVLYRAGDKIFRAPFQEGGLGKPVLLCEGDDVPEIHWAFYGPPQPKQ